MATATAPRSAQELARILEEDLPLDRASALQAAALLRATPPPVAPPEDVLRAALEDRYAGLMHERTPGKLQERLDSVLWALGDGVTRQLGDEHEWMDVDGLERVICDWIIDRAVARGARA